MSGLGSAIATVGGVGHLRPAPGTWGSLAALPLGWLVHSLGGFPLFAVATVAVFVAGLWATAEVIRGQENHDPSEVVIDEVAGQWVTLWPLSLSAWMMDMNVLRLWPGILAAFVLFRAFDIAKPGPVGLADRRGDALGVMLDDVIAGALAAMLVLVLAVAWHGM